MKSRSTSTSTLLGTIEHRTVHDEPSEGISFVKNHRQRHSPRIRSLVRTVSSPPAMSVMEETLAGSDPSSSPLKESSSESKQDNREDRDPSPQERIDEGSGDRMIQSTIHMIDENTSSTTHTAPSPGCPSTTLPVRPTSKNPKHRKSSSTVRQTSETVRNHLLFFT